MFWFFEKLAILGSDFDLKFDLTLALGPSLFNRLRTKLHLRSKGLGFLKERGPWAETLRTFTKLTESELISLVDREGL